MECGILRGRCSPDSGGSGFFTSRDLQDERGNLKWAAQTVTPQPGERGAGSDLLWGTWALQTDGHRHPGTLTRLFARAPGCRGSEEDNVGPCLQPDESGISSVFQFSFCFIIRK